VKGGWEHPPAGLPALLTAVSFSRASWAVLLGAAAVIHLSARAFPRPRLGGALPLPPHKRQCCVRDIALSRLKNEYCDLVSFFEKSDKFSSHDLLFE